MASCQEGQAYAERGRTGCAKASTEPSSRTYQRIGNLPTADYLSTASGRRIEPVQHPVDYHPGDRHVQPDRQRPSGDSSMLLVVTNPAASKSDERKRQYGSRQDDVGNQDREVDRPNQAGPGEWPGADVGNRFELAQSIQHRRRRSVSNALRRQRGSCHSAERGFGKVHTEENKEIAALSDIHEVKR